MKVQDKILEKNFLGHLQDTKWLAIRILILFILIFALSFYFAENIFSYLISIAGFSDLKMIFNSIESGFLTQISIGFNSAIIILIPYFAFEVLCFCKPVISKNKILQTFILFICGNLLYLFSLYFTVNFIIPLFIKFLISFKILGVDFYINTTNYITFILKLLIIFGFIFETPLVLILLIKSGLVKLSLLEKNRKFIFVFCFIFGAILTPPDVLSQIITAFLLYGFFEISIFVCKKI